jgi:hypothetical protein
VCGQVQWSSLERNKPAAVGYNSEGNYFSNHPLSGFSGIGDAVSCLSNIGKRRKRETGNTDSTTISFCSDADVQRAVEDCMEAEERDKSAYSNSNQTPVMLAGMLEPCPCTLQQAMEDGARFIPYVDVPGNCYVSSKPIEVRLPALGDIFLTQMCCYTENG